MTDKRLKIAYLCDISPLDRNLYSGGNARIYDALSRHAGDVTILSNSWHAAEPLRRAIMASPEALNLRLRWRAHLLAARLIAKGVQQELARGQYDVLFGAYAFQCMSRIRKPYPMVTAFTSDATPTVYKRSEVGQIFESYLSVSRLFDPLVTRAESRIFNNIDLLLWPSDWLHDEAQSVFKLPQDKAHVVPWGANVSDPGTSQDVPQLAKDTPLRLLFIGRDWFAKGGPLAHDTMRTLRDAGIDARLTVIGCHPPEFHQTEGTEVIGPLDKAKPQELQIFEHHLRTAHFIVMPSFESYGFAFCEASAYGLPNLCLRVGGVPVREGVNGHALPLEALPNDFAAVIRRYLDDPASYDALRVTTRSEYEQRLNWDAWGKTTAALLHDKVAQLQR